MNKIIVTPAGRKRYLEILLANLEKQKADFDEWHLWINTENQDDIDYIKQLADEYYWIQYKELGIPYNKNSSIHWFFQFYTDENTLYLRLDDDIVWIEPDAIKKIFKYREENPQYFLICGNVINNALCSSIHQRFGLISYNIGTCGYKCMDMIGWRTSRQAEVVHRNFFYHYAEDNLEDYKFKKWELNEYERYSINVISWFGSEFAKFNGEVGVREEEWLTETKPRQLKKMNAIYGEALFSHYAFHTQRNHLDTHTDILDVYKKLVNRGKNVESSKV